MSSHLPPVGGPNFGDGGQDVLTRNPETTMAKGFRLDPRHAGIGEAQDVGDVHGAEAAGLQRTKVTSDDCAQQLLPIINGLACFVVFPHVIRRGPYRQRQAVGLDLVDQVSGVAFMNRIDVKPRARNPSTSVAGFVEGGHGRTLTFSTDNSPLPSLAPQESNRSAASLR